MPAKLRVYKNVYSDKYQSKDGNKCFKRKAECLFSLAQTRKLNHDRKRGLFYALNGGYRYPSFVPKYILNFRS